GSQSGVWRRPASSRDSARRTGDAAAVGPNSAATADAGCAAHTAAGAGADIGTRAGLSVGARRAARADRAARAPPAARAERAAPADRAARARRAARAYRPAAENRADRTIDRRVAVDTARAAAGSPVQHTGQAREHIRPERAHCVEPSRPGAGGAPAWTPRAARRAARRRGHHLAGAAPRGAARASTLEGAAPSRPPAPRAPDRRTTGGPAVT